MSEENKDLIEENVRKNPFCVISKGIFGDYEVHDIQTNSAWSKNPYGEDYAVVPDDMVPEILETCGYCDLELNEDGTEVASFRAREIPEIPEEEPEEPEPDVWGEMAAAITEGVNEV